MPKQTRKRKHENLTEDIDQPRQKMRPLVEQTKVKEHLSNLHFGGSANFLKSLEEARLEAGHSNIDTDSGVGEEDSDDGMIMEHRSTWYEDNDDGIDVRSVLDTGCKLPNRNTCNKVFKTKDSSRQKFSSLYSRPRIHKARTESDSDDEIFHTYGFVRKNTQTNLPQKILEYKKVRDLNCDTYSEGPCINSIEFHPSSRIAFVAGTSGTSTFYTVDGRHNKKVHSVTHEQFPVQCAKFINKGSEAIVGSKHSHLFSFDLQTLKVLRTLLPLDSIKFDNFIVSPNEKYLAVAGRSGEVHILSSKTKEPLSLLKQDSNVTSLAYNSEGNLLFSHSDTGVVTIWNMNMCRVQHIFKDEGCSKGTSICVSWNKSIATGSAEGVVNLYNIDDVLSNQSPKPRKSIHNLMTEINNLKFNSTCEMLALSSMNVPNSVKLYHFNSGTLFTNFPSFETKLGYVNVLNFSPTSGYLAFGNKKSTVLLYRLKHYKNY